MSTVNRLCTKFMKQIIFRVSQYRTKAFIVEQINLVNSREKKKERKKERERERERMKQISCERLQVQNVEIIF